MYILCEIIEYDMVLCDGCGSDIQEAATDAIGNLIHNYGDDLTGLEWQFTKIYPEKKKYVPPLWKPSEGYLNEILQDGADSSVSLQV